MVSRTTQRIALWRAYGEICIYCDRPIDSLAALEIDHIIPQNLSSRPDDLQVLLNRLGRPKFEINSYLNWLPVHGYSCNLRKGGKIPPDSSLLHYLDVACQKFERVVEEEKKIRLGARNRNALIPLLHLIEDGQLSKAEAISFIELAAPKPAVRKSEPLLLAFSINVFNAIEAGVLPEDVANPPYLYDWLEDELEDVLYNYRGLFLRAAKTQSERKGEAVSVRYAFWLLDVDLLPEQLPYGWELLEVAPWSEIYPREDPDELFAQATPAKGA
jgi:hypothetical protein